MNIDTAIAELELTESQQKLIRSGNAKIEDLSELFYANIAASKPKAAISFAVEYATRWVDPVQLGIDDKGQLALIKVAPDAEVGIFDDVSCAYARSAWLAKQLVSST